jgi:hypothetical protein
MRWATISLHQDFTTALAKIKSTAMLTNLFVFQIKTPNSCWGFLSVK